MASYRDWSEQQYDAFVENTKESILYEMPIRNEIFPQAEALFEQGWLTFGEWSPDQLNSIRDAFYDLVGIQEDQFDWIEYRELYDEAA